MKQFIFLLFAVSFLMGLGNQKIYAQTQPCSATPLDVNKSVTSGSMIINNISSPYCISGGLTEVINQTWWSFRPSGNVISLTISASNCIGGNCGTGVQSTIWEAGSNCNVPTALQCQTGSSISYSVNTSPCKLYYVQVQALCESLCNITINYNKNELLSTIPAPIISGSSQICKNATAKYCAAAALQGCEPNSYKWTLNPTNAGTVTAISSEPGCANVKITNPPTNGKVRLCAEPVFTGQSLPPTINKACFDIDVLDLKPATCQVDICAEQRPFVYDLATCVKTTNPTFTGTITPSTFNINLPPGTKKTQTINYSVDGAGCGNLVTLDMQVLDNKTITLSPLLLCEGDIQSVKGIAFTCADASPSWKLFVKNGAPKPTQCDSNFKMLVQCLKINPKITGVGALDCSTTQLTLNAGSSTTSPNNMNNTTFQGVGSRKYEWSQNGNLVPNANNATLIVKTPGLYAVIVSYTYQVTQIINNQPVIVSKTCSKTTSVQILGSTNTAVAETPIPSANPCVNGVATYSVTPDPNAQSYQWSIVGNATILGSSTNPTQVEVKNSGLPYEVCLIKTACGLTSTPTCISVTPTAAPLKPIIVGKNPVCLGDSALYRVDNANVYSNTVAYKWYVTNGAITSFSSDSSEIYIKWISTTSTGKIKVKVIEPCGMSLDSINVLIKSCTTRSAGKMNLKFLLTANKLSKTITAKHQAGTETLGVGDTFAYVLHEGSSNKIIQQIAINKTGTFAFDSTKMLCGRIYYVSFVVGKNVNGLPNMQDSTLSIVPKGQAVVWFCKMKSAVAREESTKPIQRIDNQINIYPNPTDDKFMIELPNVKNVMLDLYNIQGQRLLSQKEMLQLADNQYEANIADLPKGVYLLKMNLDGKVEVRKIVVE